MESDDVVYKLVGSVLIRSDISEAKMNVDSRLDLINKQMYVVKSIPHEISKTIESEVDNNNKKIEEIRSKVYLLCHGLTRYIGRQDAAECSYEKD